jgi:hypothetical protein
MTKSRENIENMAWRKNLYTYVTSIIRMASITLIKRPLCDVRVPDVCVWALHASALTRVVVSLPLYMLSKPCSVS